MLVHCRNSVWNWTIQIVHGFARNVNSSIFLIPSLVNRWTWKLKIGLILYQSLIWLPIWNSQNCSMFPLAFAAGSLQGHWWGFISRNYVVWPIFFLMNIFIALKGTHFWSLFVPLTKEKKDRSSPCGTNKSSIISGLKFISMNINSIRGKKLELLAFLDFHQPHVVAIQETKIDSSIATSELFPETCSFSVYRKDRNIHGGGVILLVHKNISHMPITELENDSESIWVKVFANKTSHFVAVGIDRQVALVKNSNYLENSLITLGLTIRVKSYTQSMS